MPRVRTLSVALITPAARLELPRREGRRVGRLRAIITPLLLALLVVTLNAGTLLCLTLLTGCAGGSQGPQDETPTTYQPGDSSPGFIPSKGRCDYHDPTQPGGSLSPNKEGEQ